MWDAGLFCACLDKRPINHYNVIWTKIEEGAPVPSSLKSKLNALSSGAPAAPRPAASPRLMEYVSRTPAEEALFSLGEEGLRRMRFETPFDPRRALFLDTETTGLSGGAGTVAFLVGVGRFTPEGFLLRQRIMRFRRVIHSCR